MDEGVLTLSERKSRPQGLLSKIGSIFGKWEKPIDRLPTTNPASEAGYGKRLCVAVRRGLMQRDDQRRADIPEWTATPPESRMVWTRAAQQVRAMRPRRKMAGRIRNERRPVDWGDMPEATGEVAYEAWRSGHSQLPEAENVPAWGVLSAERREIWRSAEQEVLRAD